MIIVVDANSPGFLRTVWRPSWGLYTVYVCHLSGSLNTTGTKSWFESQSLIHCFGVCFIWVWGLECARGLLSIDAKI